MKKLKLILCWHMHQPHYRDGLDGKYRLPWVYLHALKDYTDMVAHLEANPKARVVVNFTPVLVEQLDDYAAKVKAWLDSGEQIKDTLLDYLTGAEPIPHSVSARSQLIQDCQKAYGPMMIEPYERFTKLIELAGVINGADSTNSHLQYLNEQYFIDILAWYHLAWTGESLRRKDDRVARLMQKACCFTSEDVRLIMEILYESLSGIIPRYRKLMEEGQIEISSTPYGHPIVPLLLDFNSMRDAMPHAPAPRAPAYPDGLNRARWHMQQSIKVHEEHFGRKPAGIWLSEGAISQEAIQLLDEFDIKWTASGEGVWRHSCERSHLNHDDIASKRALYQPLQQQNTNAALFFRDDGLSDLIGFQYKDWNPEDAANNFAHNLENIANFLGDRVENHTVTVILDGENAWEYYPDNAHHFLNALYEKLANHPRIEMTTFEDSLKQNIPLRPLDRVMAGSWVYGSFSTWIGEKDKNQGWDLLVQAKERYDSVIASGRLTQEQVDLATEQLATCEGSDWFWWFGDYNPSGSVQDFDRLYRRHLQKLYQILGETPPEALEEPISFGGGHMENAGTMRRN